MPILKVSCCGFALKEGTLFIGTVILVGSVLGLAFTALNELPLVHLSSTGMTVAILVYCLEISVSALLVTGTTKGNRWLLLPWIVISILEVVAIVIKCIFNVYISFSTLSFEELIKYVVVPFFFSALGFSIYCLVIVISRFEELKLAEMEERSNLLQMHPTTNHMNKSYASTGNAHSNIVNEEEQ